MNDVSLAGKLIILAVIIVFVIGMAYVPKIMAKFRGTDKQDM
jgi:uncharacterized protein (UPF0333 family)